jgi:hypothetical protein
MQATCFAPLVLLEVNFLIIFVADLKYEAFCSFTQFSGTFFLPLKTNHKLCPSVLECSHSVFLPSEEKCKQKTPRSRVLPEKLKCPKLLKKFSAFYGTRRFITAFTRARHQYIS